MSVGYTAPSRSPEKAVIPSVAAKRRGTGLSAGGAGDRRDAAFADRSRHRHRADCLVLRCARMGACGTSTSWRPRRARSFERTQQGDPAVRDRRGARHPCAGRAKRQGRRPADRTRSDDERRRARPSQDDSVAERLEGRAPARGASRRRRAATISSARRMPTPTLVATQRQLPDQPGRPNNEPSSPRSHGQHAQKEAERQTICGDDRQARCTDPRHRSSVSTSAKR